MRPALAIFLLISIPGLAQKDHFQETIRQLTEKTAKYLDKEKALSGYYTLAADGILMYGSPEQKKSGKPEFVLPYALIDVFCKEVREGRGFEWYQKGRFDPQGYKRTESKELPVPDTTLKGLRIAIDPGHIAGDFLAGDLEKKRLCFPKDSLKGLGDTVQFAEGMLTYATAILLREKLEAKGAEVMLTRKCKDCSAFGNTFEEWKKKDYLKTVDTLYTLGRISLSQKKFFHGRTVNDRDIFRVIFRDWELQERGKLINAFQPDLTVIIHYNVDETNLEWLKPTDRNFNMCFVAGAFMKGDLSRIEKRFEFLRLLVTDDLERSIALSGEVIQSFEAILKVPTAEMKDAKYLRESCLPTSRKGVYCRNLQLPRYVHSPVVYGETLYQDNFQECQALNEEEDKTKNARVKQVAEAYYEGITHYLSGTR